MKRATTECHARLSPFILSFLKEDFFSDVHAFSVVL